MKITRRSGGVGTPGFAPGIQSASGVDGGGEKPQASKAADSVSLSQEARLLNRLKKQSGSGDAGSSERVAELRKKVAEGRYAPAPTAVAKSFLREVLAYFLRS